MNKEECEKALETIGDWPLWDSERTESRRRTNRMKKIIALLVMVIALFGCNTDAENATYNIKQDAEQFKIIRRIIFMNNITGEYLFEAEGNCSVETNTQAGRLELTCKVGEDKYKVHYFGLSDNTSYIVEQMEWKEENKYRYKIIFKPESIIPIEFDVE